MAKEGSKVRKGSLRGINLRTANNGYSVDHDVEPEQKPAGGGNQAMPVDYHPPKPDVFPDRKSVVNHIDQMLAAHEGTAANAGADATQDADPDDAPVPQGRAAFRQSMGGGK